MENTQKGNKLFSTRDIYLATTLNSLKFYHVNIDFQAEGDNNQLVGYFIFENSNLLQEAVEKYWRAELLIEPREFVNNMRALKSQLTSVYKNPRNA